MPGQLWNSFRQGNRSEYLANYLLSALGIAVKVPREEDVGVDFHCNLASDFGNGILQFFAPYNIQIKSGSGGGERISYGGIEKDKVKDYEVRWLLAQRTPFFLGLVDKSEGSIRVYCTATRWLAQFRTKVPCEIVFAVDTPDARTDLGFGTEVPRGGTMPDGVEACSLEIPLGQPIFTLNAEQAEDATLLWNRRNVFKDYIYLDERNSVYFGMGVHAFYWPLRISTNNGLMIQGISVGWGGRSELQQKQMCALGPLVASLQRTYLLSGQTIEAAKFTGLLDLIPKTQEFDLIRRLMEDSATMIASKGSTGMPGLSAASVDFGLPSKV